MGIPRLKESVLWRDSARAARTYAEMTASILEAMAFQFLMPGNGMRWTEEGCLRDEDGHGQRPAYAPAQPDADPGLHPLFNMVPAIDDARFLKYMSMDPFKDEPQARMAGRSFAIQEDSPILSMRGDVDIHHLVGAAIFMKHYLAHPERLRDSRESREVQLGRARQCLNGCFEIVEECGAGMDFVSSCADYTAALDEMTAMSDDHVRQAKVSYDTQLMHKGLMDGLTGAVKKALTDDGTQPADKKRNQEMLRSALERFGKGPKP